MCEDPFGNPVSPCDEYYVVKDSANYPNVLQAWQTCMEPSQTSVKGVTYTRRGIPAIWWGSDASYNSVKLVLKDAFNNGGVSNVWTSLNDVCQSTTETITTVNPGKGGGGTTTETVTKSHWNWDGFGLNPTATTNNLKSWELNRHRGRHFGQQTTQNFVADECSGSASACTNEMEEWIEDATGRIPWRSNEPNGDGQERCSYALKNGDDFELVDTACYDDQVDGVLCMTTDVYFEELTTGSNQGNYLVPSMLQTHDDATANLVGLTGAPTNVRSFLTVGGYYPHYDAATNEDTSFFSTLMATECVSSPCNTLSQLGIGIQCRKPLSLAEHDATGVVSGASAGRRLQSDETDETSRIVQWDGGFRQPAFGDSSHTAFTGPLFADCSDPNVPDTHCCRARTSFWVSNDETHEYWLENTGVTKCAEDVCGKAYQRTGEDTQCVPVQPECNDWDGSGSLQFSVGGLVLLEAYCMCGMRLSAVPQGRRLDSTDDNWKWPDAHTATIDTVGGGHFEASDQCYASSVNFHTNVLYAVANATCPTSAGSVAFYPDMAASDVVFAVGETSPYPTCAEADATDALACCSVTRTDAAASHYYSVQYPRHPALNGMWSAFGTGHPFGVGPSTSALIFAFDFNNDGYDDVVVGNRLYASSLLAQEQQWGAQRHLGKQFTSATPTAMDAVHVASLGTIFTAIAFADNSVTLYTSSSSSPDSIVFHYNRTLDDGGHGAVSSISMFTRATTHVVERERVAIYVGYTDADDVIHTVDFPKSATDRALGYLPRASTAVPTRSGANQRTVPTLCSSSAIWRTNYPQDSTGTRQETSLLFIGTPVGFPNLVAENADGFVERPLGAATDENSVAVSATAYEDATDFRVLVCFANTNTQDVCYLATVDTRVFPNERFAEFQVDAIARTPFGDAHANTADIAVRDLDADGYPDVITLEESGYVRIYRGDAVSAATGGFAHTVPEPLDHRHARPTRTLHSVPVGYATGDERFMSSSRLLVGSCDHCTSAVHPTRRCGNCPATHPHCVAHDGVADACARTSTITLDSYLCDSSWASENEVFTNPCPIAHPFCIDVDPPRADGMGICTTVRPADGVSETTIYARTDDRGEWPANFLLTHHHNANAGDGPSCSMRCHESGRMGYDGNESNAFFSLPSVTTLFLYSQVRLLQALRERRGHEPRSGRPRAVLPKRAAHGVPLRPALRCTYWAGKSPALLEPHHAFSPHTPKLTLCSFRHRPHLLYLQTRRRHRRRNHGVHPSRRPRRRRRVRRLLF